MSDLPIRDSLPLPVRQAAGADAPPRGVSPSRAPEPTGAELRVRLAAAIDAIAPHASGLEFVVDGAHTIVRVLDKETNKVLRQIPAPEMLALGQALDRLQGLLIRLRA